MKRKVLNNTASNTFKVDFPEFVMLMTDGYKDNKEKKVNDEETQREKRLEEREEEICDLFNLFDRDGSGSISLEELAQVMIRFGGLNKEDIDLLVIQADLDGDGMVIFVIFQITLYIPYQKQLSVIHFVPPNTSLFFRLNLTSFMK